MGLYDLITASRSILDESDDALAAYTRELEDTNELLSESLADAQLAFEDRGWRLLSDALNTEFTREGLRRAADVCAASAVVNPLIGRGINLRIAYVWGQGVHIAARQEDSAEQDLNAVVQAFLDDPSNQASFASSQAREELERALGTGGNVFLALFTSPLTGRVQVRSVPFGEIDDAIDNPEDRDDPWFYQRTYTVDEVIPTVSGTTVTRATTRTVLHPAVGYWPKLRPRSINGHEVRWDAPILHVSVNRLDGWKFGIGDAYAAVSWARAYKEFLEDWARLVKALSRFAFRTTSKGRNAATVRQRLTPTGSGPDQVGATVLTGEGQAFEAIPKTGATIDSGSGQPLAAMVASAFDVPVTMLLCDPGVTGARATAETLDQPMQLIMRMRQELWKSAIRRVLDYVIDQAVKAPQGPLKGTRTVDQVTGREVVTLVGEQDRTVDITFPDLSKVPLDVLVTAIKTADDTGKLPPLLVARLLMEVLGVSDVDELLAQLTDGDGNFVDPFDAAAARAQQDAVRAGDQPKD